MGDRYPSDWNRRRKKVYKRDNYRCQRCGSKGGKYGDAELHAHHINPISEGGSHRYSNLKTVCQSCHKDIHGHGVGGKTSSSTENSYEADPVAVGLGLAIILTIASLYATYIAIGQVMPAGQTDGEKYTIEYAAVTDDPDGYGHDYDYRAGHPLIVRYELSDNVISENGEANLTVEIRNPSTNRMEGVLTVNWKTNYYLNGELATINFDLSPGEHKEVLITLPGKKLAIESEDRPRTVEFGAEAWIFTEPYSAISTDKVDSIEENEMILEIRKPLFSRFGFYWLSFISFIGVFIGYLIWKDRGDAPTFLSSFQ